MGGADTTVRRVAAEDRALEAAEDRADSGWTVYVLQCADGTLYTGITTDPDRRVAEHNRGVGSRYTRARMPVTLVYSEIAQNRSEATKRETSIKRMSRATKMRLIFGEHRDS